MLTPYQDGYRKGYLEAQLEVLGVRNDAGYLEAQAQQQAEQVGQGLTDEQLSSFWLGFYHGRYHGRTGEAAEGARRGAN